MIAMTPVARARRPGSTSPDAATSASEHHQPLLGADTDDVSASLLDPLADGANAYERGRDTPRRNDAAADLMRRIGVSPERRVKVTPEEDARVLHLIDLFVLPLMLAVYFLQGLDKATIAYASIFGLIEDTGLVDDQFSWLGSIVYVAQLIAQFPLAWLLVKLPIGKFTSCMVLFWGATLSLMAFAHSFRSLLFARFWLGAFEASIAPSFVAITQMFWRRREQPLRMSYWYAMNGFTHMFGSLITWGLAQLSLGLKPYQIIFLFFGIVTVGFSFVLFAYMPDSPAEAKFLNKHDKLVAIERLRMNQTGVVSREWRWDHLWESVRDPKTWLWFALIFCISVPSGGVTTFGPLLVKSFGFDSFHAILFNSPFGLVQLFSTVGGAFIAMKYHKKGPVIAGLATAPIIGCLVMLATPRTPDRKAPLLFGYYMISVYPGIIPLIYSWSSSNTGGDTKGKCTSSALFIGQSLGNILGPLLYKPSEAPEYSRGLQWNLVLYCAIIVLVGVTSSYLAYLNREHSQRRVKAGKDAVIVDYSLYSAEEADRLRRTHAVDRAESAATNEETGAHAFEDLTDLQNNEFIFVF
ncbi:major facilitator superfamily domain-containing protein [Stachybotrys elegans]|uniref:Major facilitator superfamily domain-containing protein n=1 Tax=Stachybotrys elegans TaxID=80388 RepID=A0A8K0SV02_9HYPO|nr:major facilitator superfamily domain-containing protein [Stachybotrys elegans]